jgi:hypothetical protein
MAKPAEASLEQALEAHKRGLELARFCQERLEAAQRQVKVLEGDWCLRSSPWNPSPVTAPDPGFAAWMGEVQARMEAVLARVLPAAGIVPAKLHAAMRYAVLGGGKRVRPLLAYAAGELAGAAWSAWRSPPRQSS